MYTFLYILSQHQQQVATAVERAKQVTMTELNAIIGVRCNNNNNVSVVFFLYVLGCKNE